MMIKEDGGRLCGAMRWNLGYTNGNGMNQSISKILQPTYLKQFRIREIYKIFAENLFQHANNVNNQNLKIITY